MKPFTRLLSKNAAIGRLNLKKYRQLLSIPLYCNSSSSRLCYSNIAYVPPSLSKLNERWQIMDKQLQDEIIEYLEWKMEDPDWKNMTSDEIKSIYYISYGSWGPRKQRIQNNTVYIIFRFIFNLTLLASLGVAYKNWSNDRRTQKELGLTKGDA